MGSSAPTIFLLANKTTTKQNLAARRRTDDERSSRPRQKIAVRRRPDDDEKEHVPPPERPITDGSERPGEGQAAAGEEPRRDLDMGHKQAEARRRRGVGRQREFDNSEARAVVAGAQVRDEPFDRRPPFQRVAARYHGEPQRRRRLNKIWDLFELPVREQADAPARRLRVRERGPRDAAFVEVPQILRDGR